MWPYAVLFRGHCNPSDQRQQFYLVGSTGYIRTIHPINYNEISFSRILEDDITLHVQQSIGTCTSNAHRVMNTKPKLIPFLRNEGGKKKSRHIKKTQNCPIFYFKVLDMKLQQEQITAGSRTPNKN